MNRSALATLVLLCTATAACDSDPTGTFRSPGSIELRPFILRMLPGDSTVLTAEVRDGRGSTVTAAVAWETVNQGAQASVTVSPRGVLRAETPGWALVRVRVAGRPGLRDSLWVAVSTRYRSLSVGGGVACAISHDDETHCWGVAPANYAYVFGPALPRAGAWTPTPLLVTSDATLVEVGPSHVCRIVSSGETRCWGNNLNGELGNLLGSDHQSAVAVPEPLDTVVVGWLHACGNTADDRVFCWGLNRTLQVGVPEDTLGRGIVPTPVELGLRLKVLAAGGEHTCGLDAEARAYCWGSNEHGELGRGSTGEPMLPGPVDTEERFRAISAQITGMQTWALTVDGRLFRWGGGVTRPEPFATSRRFQAVSPPCAISTEGAVYCQRDDELVQRPAGVEFTQVEAGPLLACSLSVAGGVYCWVTTGLEPDWGWTGTGLPGRDFPILIAPPGPVPDLEETVP